MYLKWSQAVQDKEFLVEMRLRNLKPEGPEGNAVEEKRKWRERKRLGFGTFLDWIWQRTRVMES